MEEKGSSSKKQQIKLRKIHRVQDFDQWNRSSLDLSEINNRSFKQHTKTKKQQEYNFLPKVGFGKVNSKENSPLIRDIRKSGQNMSNRCSFKESPGNILKLLHKKFGREKTNNISSSSNCSPQDEDIEFKPRLKNKNCHDVNFTKKDSEIVIDNGKTCNQLCRSSTVVKTDEVESFVKTKPSNLCNYEVINENSGRKKSLNNTLSQSFKTFVNLTPDTLGNNQGIFNVTYPIEEEFFSQNSLVNSSLDTNEGHSKISLAVPLNETIPQNGIVSSDKNISVTKFSAKKSAKKSCRKQKSVYNEEEFLSETSLVNSNSLEKNGEHSKTKRGSKIRVPINQTISFDENVTTTQFFANNSYTKRKSVCNENETLNKSSLVNISSSEKNEEHCKSKRGSKISLAVPLNETVSLDKNVSVTKFSARNGSKRSCGKQKNMYNEEDYFSETSLINFSALEKNHEHNKSQRDSKIKLTFPLNQTISLDENVTATKFSAKNSYTIGKSIYNENEVLNKSSLVNISLAEKTPGKSKRGSKISLPVPLNETIPLNQTISLDKNVSFTKSCRKQKCVYNEEECLGGNLSPLNKNEKHRKSKRGSKISLTVPLNQTFSFDGNVTDARLSATNTSRNSYAKRKSIYNENKVLSDSSLVNLSSLEKNKEHCKSKRGSKIRQSIPLNQIISFNKNVSVTQFAAENDSHNLSTNRKGICDESVINLLTPSPKSNSNQSLSTPTPTKWTPSPNKSINLDNSELNNTRKSVRKRWTKCLAISLVDNAGNICISEPTANEPLINQTETALSQIKKTKILNKVAKISSPLPLLSSTPMLKTNQQTEMWKPLSNKKNQIKSIKKTKLPNFAQIHQKAYEKLEDIKELKERKAARAQKLLSGQKPVIGFLRISPSKSRKALHYSPLVKQPIIENVILSKNPPEKVKTLSKPIQKKIEITKLKSCIPVSKQINNITEKKLLPKTKPLDKKCIPKPALKTDNNLLKKKPMQQEQLKDLVNKKRVVTEPVEKRRKVVQNVRTNRRFELLMQMRKK